MFFFLCLAGFSLLSVIADSKSIAFENNQIGNVAVNADDAGINHFQVKIKIWAGLSVKFDGGSDQGNKGRGDLIIHLSFKF
jgi:hypothetical protein